MSTTPLQDQIQQLIATEPVVVFIKGKYRGRSLYLDFGQLTGKSEGRLP